MDYNPEQDMNIKKEKIEGKDYKVIVIEDNGIGWLWDDMPKQVRDKYLRAKYLIESMGGKFFYEATPGKGSRVTIMIPEPKKE